MLQNIPIMEIDIDDLKYKTLREDLLPVRMRGIYKKDFPDINNRKEYELYTGTFMSFLSHRILNLSRENAKMLLNAFHFSQSQDDYTKMKIAIVCKAVSMSDDYWLNTQNKTFSWEEICVRNNSLNKIVTSIALTGASLTVEGIPHTPELATQGAYAKAWVREKDGIYLYKAGTREGKEHLIDISCSQILDCFDIEHVPYSLGKFVDGDKELEVSKCPLMNSDKYSVVPAEEFYSFCCRQNIDFISECQKIDERRFYQTCIVDYLISNADRHMQNWGFFMNNQTGQLEKCHPLFDHNNAFYKFTMNQKDGGPCQLLPQYSQKEAAHFANRKYPLQCIKPISKNIFLNDEHYESFMERACELGIYKRQKLTFIDKVFNTKKEEYIPDKIILHTDDSSENESLTNEDEKIDIDDIMKKHESSEENFKTQKWIEKEEEH